MKMKNLLLSSGMALGVAFASGASAGEIIIDLFNGDQAVSDYTLGGGTVWAPEYAGLDVLGGFRDIGVNCLTGCTANRGTRMDTGGGILAFSNDTLVNGMGYVVWDGAGTGAGAAGLGGIDLTLGGTNTAIQLNTISSDGGLGSQWQFSLYASDVANNWTRIDFQASEVSSPTISYIDLNGFAACGAVAPGVISITCSGGPGFGNGVNLTALNLLAVTFNLNGIVDVDLALDSAKAVPVPSTLATFGLGLLVAGAMYRRRLASAS